MKIAMIGQKGIPATYGGVERHVEELAVRLVRMGHEVTAYCRRHYVAGSPGAEPVRVQGVGDKERPERLRVPLPQEGGAYRGVKMVVHPSLNTKRLDAATHTALAVLHAVRQEYDVIHFHAVGPTALSFVPRLPFSWLKGKRFRRKTAVVATIHSLDWRRRKWGPVARAFLRLGGWAARRFPDRTIAVSQTIVAHFGERGKELVYIPNGVEAARKEPLEELRKFGIDRKGYVLWIGRFVPEKRVEDLIAAYRRVAPPVPLVLAGEVDERDSYMRSLRDAAAGEPRIFFTGGLYGRAKAEAFSHAGLVVQPSDLEGFPIVLLEAMRHGRPILASDIPEHMEAIRPGENGFLFRVRDVDSLRKNLAWALANPDALAAAGRQAEVDAREYNWDTVVEKTAMVYEEALRTARSEK